MIWNIGQIHLGGSDDDDDDDDGQNDNDNFTTFNTLVANYHTANSSLHGSMGLVPGAETLTMDDTETYTEDVAWIISSVAPIDDELWSTVSTLAFRIVSRSSDSEGLTSPIQSSQ